MGYSTEFSGTIYFKHELTASQIAAIEKFFGADMREHPEWKEFMGLQDPNGWLNYIPLEFNDSYSGLQWDGSEKASGVVEFLNLIRNYMYSIDKPIVYKDGEIFAQGEEATDRWWVKVEDNTAKAVDIVVTGRTVECPNCEHEFLIDLEEENG